MKTLFPQNYKEANEMVDSLITTAKLIGYNINKQFSAGAIKKLKMIHGNREIIVYTIKDMKSKKISVRAKIFYDKAQNKFQPIKTYGRPFDEILKEIGEKL